MPPKGCPFGLSDGRWFAKVLFLRGHPAASLTNVSHGLDLVFAHVLGIHLRGAAKAAFGFVSTGIAQVPRIIGNCSTILTCIHHCFSPFWMNKVKPRKIT